MHMQFTSNQQCPHALTFQVLTAICPRVMCRCFLSEANSDIAAVLKSLLQQALDVARAVLSAHLSVPHAEFPLHCDGSTVWTKVNIASSFEF